MDSEHATLLLRLSGRTQDEVANASRKADESVSDDETSSTPETDPDKTVRALIEECEDILAGNPALLIDDTLLKVASVFTNAEIVEKAISARGATPLSSRLISDRLVKAIKRAAEKEGKTKEEVKARLDTDRRANGVMKRKNTHANAKRAASMASKKQTSKRANPDGEDRSEEDSQGDRPTQTQNPKRQKLNDGSTARQQPQGLLTLAQANVVLSSDPIIAREALQDNGNNRITAARAWLGSWTYARWLEYQRREMESYGSDEEEDVKEEGMETVSDQERGARMEDGFDDEEVLEMPNDI